MSVKEAGETQSQEAKPTGGFPWAQTALGLGILGTAGVVAFIGLNRSQSLSQQLSVLNTVKQNELAQKNAELARVTKEQERMAAQLKKAFATQKSLLKERDDLANKLKTFSQPMPGSASGGIISSSLPDAAMSVEPIIVRPLPAGPATSGGGFTLKDGGKLLVQRPDGFYQLNKLPTPYQAALGSSGLKVSGLPRLLSRQPAPAEGLFRVTAPVKTLLETAKPTFQWTAAPEAGTKYQVIVTGEDGKQSVKSPWIDGLTWTPETPLPRGKIYRWKILALGGAGQEPKERAAGDAIPFAIVGDGEMAALERVRKESPDSHLLMGVAYAEAGLISKAEESLQALKKANPMSPVPDALLLQIRRAAS